MLRKINISFGHNAESDFSKFYRKTRLFWWSLSSFILLSARAAKLIQQIWHYIEAKKFEKSWVTMNLHELCEIKIGVVNMGACVFLLGWAIQISFHFFIFYLLFPTKKNDVMKVFWVTLW